jgi:hypothetical protein
MEADIFNMKCYAGETTQNNRTPHSVKMNWYLGRKVNLGHGEQKAGVTRTRLHVVEFC